MTRSTTSVAIAAFAVGLALLAAGCGDSNGSHVAQLGPTSTSTASTTPRAVSSGSTEEQALGYARWGALLPAPWTHRGYGLPRLVGLEYMGLEGLFGSIASELGISADKLVSLFGQVSEGLRLDGLVSLWHPAES